MSQRILVVTRNSPFTGSSGAGTYLFSVLQYLRNNGFIIRVLWTEPPDTVPTGGWYRTPEKTMPFSLAMAGMLRIGDRFWAPQVCWLPLKAKLLHHTKRALQGARLRRRTEPGALRKVPPSIGIARWDQEVTPSEVRAIAVEARRWKPDVVLASYSWMVPGIRAAAVEAPIAALTYDVRHRQVHLSDAGAFEVLGEHMVAEIERQQLESADVVIAIQSTEAAIFRRLLPAKVVLTAPMAVTPNPQPSASLPFVLFVGSGHQANVSSLRWFREEIWPAVRRALPDAVLLVAGTICKSLDGVDSENIHLLGESSDLAEAYRRAALAVVPIQKGSGIKIKLVEAVAHGRGCVTTSVGIDGLEFLRPAARIADSATMFAATVVELLQNQAVRSGMERAARELALTVLSEQACYGELVRVLSRLKGARRSTSERGSSDDSSQGLRAEELKSCIR